jgi:hypothetical protein
VTSDKLMQEIPRRHFISAQWMMKNWRITLINGLLKVFICHVLPRIGVILTTHDHSRLFYIYIW